MIIKELLAWAIGELKKNGISEPEGSAVLLLAKVLEKDRAYLYSHGEEKVTKAQEKKYREYISRRKTHEPVWYILGEVEFYGRKFNINNNVLTPRPETELLVQEVLKSISNFQFPISNVIELGTGSGIIVITLAKELEGIKYQVSCIKYVATDISPTALDVAKDNAKRLDADIEFLQGDLLSPLTTQLKFQTQNSRLVLVANLPYIPREDMSSLQFDVLHHEPRVALDGGLKGLEIYERLLGQMKEFGFCGMVFFEIGINQGNPIKKMIKKYFPKAKVMIKGDLAGIDRIAVINVTSR